MNGIILIDKPKDYTSRDIVNIVGKKLKTKKVGHTGTLDPLATGLLVITIGKATKLTEMILSLEKEYICKARIGIETDTLDVSGKVLKESDSLISEEQLKNVIASFQKTYLQEVPMYSAVKVKGKKLYEYARSGKSVTLPRKEVTIKEIELLDFEENTFTFKTKVSKGTYIRSLVRDIGVSLGTYATMEELRRISSGKYKIEEACTLEEFEEGKLKLIDMVSILKDYKQVEVDDKLLTKINNGVILDNLYQEDIVVFLKNNQVIAIYEKYKKDEKKIKPKMVFKNEE